jgi:hypothetical protein
MTRVVAAPLERRERARANATKAVASSTRLFGSGAASVGAPSRRTQPVVASSAKQFPHPKQVNLSVSEQEKAPASKLHRNVSPCPALIVADVPSVVLLVSVNVSADAMRARARTATTTATTLQFMFPPVGFPKAAKPCMILPSQGGLFEFQSNRTAGFLEQLR